MLNLPSVTIELSGIKYLKLVRFFKVSIVVRLQYCGDCQSGIHNAITYAYVRVHAFPFLHLNVIIQ